MMHATNIQDTNVQDGPDGHLDAVVVGGGPIGLAATLALNHAGLRVACVAGSRSPPDDGRSAAILEPSWRYLDRLGAGAALEMAGTTLLGIRIIDATNSLFKAPPLTFRASEINQPRFGINVPTNRIVTALSACLEAKAVPILAVDVQSVDLAGALPQVTLASGETLRAAVLVAADGAKSTARTAARIATRSWAYDQVALTFRVSHARDHEEISTEFHTREGPFTLVPNGSLTSNVVWMVKPEHGRALMAMDDETFAMAAENASHSILGRLKLLGARGMYPMRGLLAARAARGRVALVGEAAHVFPPIGAQGLNLGIRDVKALAECLAPARGRLDAGSVEAKLGAYASARQFDLASRTAAVDLLNRSLLSGILPADLARGIGMSVLARVGPLRRIMMRTGLAGSLA